MITRRNLKLESFESRHRLDLYIQAFLFSFYDFSQHNSIKKLAELVNGPPQAEVFLKHTKWRPISRREVSKLSIELIEKKVFFRLVSEMSDTHTI